MSKIVDFSKVSSQSRILQSYPSKPNAQSDLHIDRDVDTSGKHHKITGLNLVIKDGHPHHIWKDYNIPRSTSMTPSWKPSTESLIIFCDTLEIHGEFNIPETHIAIFARKLIWVDTNSVASINTSPLEWDSTFKKAPQFTDGEPGRSAGNIYIDISRIALPIGINRDKKRLIANGGKGQDAGAGEDGKNGKTIQGWSVLTFEHIGNKATVPFSPPATHVHYWWDFGHSGTFKRDYGTLKWPEKGKDAIAPGNSGNGGNGGRISFNLEELEKKYQNEAGQVGVIERTFNGGKPGEPNPCAHYSVRLNGGIIITETNHFDIYDKEIHTGEEGKSISSKKGKEGKEGEKKTLTEKNGWLHPFNLQRTLEYIRMLFLANAREDAEKLLVEYQEALNLEMPKKLGYWNPSTYPEWVSAKNEVANMLQNLRSNLDYFGNRGGYMPFFSLPSSLVLYEREREQTFKTLLLSNFVQKDSESIETRKQILDKTIENLGEASKIASQKIIEQSSKVDELKEGFKSVENKVDKLHNDLEILRSELKEEAGQNIAQLNAIKFSVNMAATIACIIPVGQPVLGAVASLASVATDYATSSDEDAGLNALKATGSVFKETGDKFTEKMDKLKEEAEEANNDESVKNPTIEKMKKWADVSSGVGNFISDTSENLKMLQVDKSEVDAELERLKAKDPRWKKLTERIRELNNKKVEILSKMDELYSEIGGNYALMLSNSSAIQQMRQERTIQSGKLSSEAVGFIRQIEQRSRLFLMRYTYLMVKSYETTLFKQFTNEKVWSQTELMKKLHNIIDGNSFKSSKINEWIEQLRPAFEQDIQVIRSELLDYIEGNKGMEYSRPLSLTFEQTPELLQKLNSNQAINIYPFEFGVISYHDNLAKIKNIVLEEIEFDPNGPQPVDTKSLIFSLKPLHDGIMRKDEQLYSIYSETNFEWRYSCYFGKTTKIETSKDSKVNEDMMKFILGEKGVGLEQKIAKPPVWSNYEISLIDNPYSPEDMPRITKLMFKVEMDIVPIRHNDQSVLVISSESASPLTTIDCQLADLARRKNGPSKMIRVYNENKKVILKAPNEVDDKKFVSWRVDGEIKSDLEISIDTKKGNMIIEHFWKDSKSPKLEISSAPIAIKTEAKEDASVLSYIESISNATILLEKDEWKQINYKGIVGWVK